MILTAKQGKALKYLQDKVITELLFGGGAGGGKSALGCYWVVKNCFKYPGSRWLIGRSKLKTLKETTLVTFFEVLKMQSITSEYWDYNQTQGTINFINGSQVLLKDLFFYPSDSDFDELGSLEITGGFIDEASQVVLKAKNIVKSRIRFKLDEYGLIPKLLMTTNPSKGWPYNEFYKPFKEGTLPEHRTFVQSLHLHNRHLSKHYANNLDGLDRISRSRLKLGIWEIDDDESLLVDYDAVNDLFTNDHVIGSGVKRVSADLAMQGRDKFIVGLWDDGLVKIALDKPKSSGKSIENDLRGVLIEHKVGRSNTVVDSDGLGAYLDSYLTGIKTFHGNATPIRSKEFKNIKSQCAFKLAEKINKREIRILCTPEQKERISEELMICLKRDNLDKDDTRKSIISKDKSKEILNRSPDYFDMLNMGMIFYLRKDYF